MLFVLVNVQCWKEFKYLMVLRQRKDCSYIIEHFMILCNLQNASVSIWYYCPLHAPVLLYTNSHWKHRNDKTTNMNQIPTWHMGNRMQSRRPSYQMLWHEKWCKNTWQDRLKHVSNGGQNYTWQNNYERYNHAQDLHMNEKLCASIIRCNIETPVPVTDMMYKLFAEWWINGKKS